MGEKLSGKDGPAKATRKETRETPGKGHNIDALRKGGEAFVKQFIAKSEAMESDMAGYRSEIGDIYEKAAEKLGLKKSVVQAELKRILKAKKQHAKEQEMSADEREQTELWRTAMEGTQWELFAAGDLAEPLTEG